ncbi:hypothetical protein MAHJHV33_49950 [Mycobacterium avium subsp. hominissuis]
MLHLDRFQDDQLGARGVIRALGRHLDHGAGQLRPQPGAVELYPGEDALRAQLAGTVVEVAPEGADYPAGATSTTVPASCARSASSPG